MRWARWAGWPSTLGKTGWRRPAGMLRKVRKVVAFNRPVKTLYQKPPSGFYRGDRVHRLPLAAGPDIRRLPARGQVRPSGHPSGPGLVEKEDRRPRACGPAAQRGYVSCSQRATAVDPARRPGARASGRECPARRGAGTAVTRASPEFVRGRARRPAVASTGRSRSRTGGDLAVDQRKT